MSKKYLFFITIFIVIITAYFLVHFYQKQTNEENQLTILQSTTKVESNQISQSQFFGEKGESIDLVSGFISIAANVLNDNCNKI